MPGNDPSEDTLDVVSLKQALAERTRELHEAREKLKLTEKQAMLGQLASTVAHELRSPLGAMLTSLHLVEARVGETDQAAKNGLERIRRSVRRCDEIITNLLDYARYEPLAPEETRIDQWLQAFFRSQPLPQGVSLAFRPGFGEGRARVDRDRLLRAVRHLIDNAAQAALHAGKPGQVTVATREHNGKLEIRVADNGPGIPEDHQARIFEPFFSGRKAGIGLGLPIARSAVEQHGGSISFRSVPGAETEFTISLPL